MSLARAGAEARNGQLTKPPGALGRLEELAIWYCGWRGDATARIIAPQVAVFAGNHGVTAQGVSAFPADVTAQMVANFEAGGAAINQLAEMAGARLDVVPIALDRPTADFTQGPAMDAEAFAEALAAGWNAVDTGADLLVTGEMGIGNTTSAAAIAHALYGGAAEDWTGRGTGVDDAGLAAKTAAVAAGVAANAEPR
jgi:nicotinate-nucleotide--dimethylbenzimidazole phosphoribosyltransferase